MSLSATHDTRLVACSSAFATQVRINLVRQVYIVQKAHGPSSRPTGPRGDQPKDGLKATSKGPHHSDDAF